ncbi:MAG TPA: hypothetical protein VGC97_09310 [Pyrinomonadaceae bacterium]|jgi:hypothetical protein
MNKKEPTEQEKFNETMDKLLSVPYSELKKKLDEEKEAKKNRKKGNRSISSGSHVSQKVK